MRKAENPVYTFLKACFAACFLLAFGLISFSSGYMIAVCAVYIFCAFLILPRIPQKYFVWVLCALTVVMRLAVIYLNRTMPVSDFALQYEAAQKFAVGDYSYLEQNYFKTWGYQIGLVIYEGILLKICNHLVVLKLSNALFETGTVLLIYLITRKATGELAARIVSTLYTVMVFPMLHVTVLDNSIPSAFFILLAVYFACQEFSREKMCFKNCCLIGVCCVAAQFFRPDTMLLLLALGATALFSWIRCRTKQNALTMLSRLAVIFGLYFVLFQIISYGTYLLGFTANGLVNENPMWKLVLGTDYESKGRWNTEVYERLSTIMAEKNLTYAEAEWEVISENLSVSARELFELLYHKVYIFWGTTSLTFSMTESDLCSQLTSLANAQQKLLLLLAALGGIAFFRRKQSAGSYIIPFFIMATFFVYLVIEVQPRYSYLVQMFLAIMAANFLREVEPYIRRISDKIRFSEPDESEDPGQLKCEKERKPE